MFFLIPIPAPNVFPWLYILRGLIAVLIIGLTSNPLTADYVEKNTRGRANALVQISGLFGGVIGLVLLFTVVKFLSLGEQFQLIGFVHWVAAIVTFFMIKEPRIFENIDEEHKDNENIDHVWTKMTLLEKIQQLSGHLIRSTKENIIIPVAYASNFALRISGIMSSNFFTLWITSFVGTEYIGTYAEA